jgi:hypothetical protein
LQAQCLGKLLVCKHRCEYMLNLRTLIAYCQLEKRITVWAFSSSITF